MCVNWKDTISVLPELEKILGREVTLYDLDACQINDEEKNLPDPRVEGFISQFKTNTDDFMAIDLDGGLTMLCIDEHPVGVLSIKGLGPDEKGQLLIGKRLAELLYKEAIQQAKNDINRQELIKQWIFNNYVSDDSSFETRMSVAGIDLSGCHLVAVLRVLTYDLEPISPQDMEQMRRALPHYLDRLENLVDYLVVENKFIFLLHTQDDLTAQRNLRELKVLLETNYCFRICGGIGQVCREYTKLGNSYEQADKSCCISQKSRGTQIMRYDELSIDLLVEEIPPQIKVDFVNKVFGGCKKSDVDEWRVLLRAFFVSNGSISKVSEELFIHKNTLQYKLNKIRKQTGYDPRNTCDALKLYLAILFSSNLRY